MVGVSGRACGTGGDWAGPGVRVAAGRVAARVADGAEAAVTGVREPGAGPASPGVVTSGAVSTAEAASAAGAAGGVITGAADADVSVFVAAPGRSANPTAAATPITATMAIAT